jgi:DNA-binding CsgD family transcriptional regulator
VEAEANNQMSWLLTLRGRSSEALEHSARAVALPSSSAEVRSLYWRHHAWALGDMDRIEEAETALAVARSSAEEQGLAGVAVSILMESAHLRYSMGRWEEAAVDADTAAAIALELDGVLEADPEGVVLWIAYHRREGGERIREPRADAGSGDAFLETLEAVAASDRGDIDGACRSARGLLNRIGRIGSRNRREFDVLPPLVGISMGAGDTESAVLGRETAARLARGDAPGAALADARCRVIVDGDVAAARRAVDLARRSPRMLLAAEGLEDAAAVLPREDAVPVLEEASSLYEQIGAARDLARVAAKLKGLGARAPVAPVRARPVSGWEALTPAELEVVRLAADGLTNRQIGSRLFVSHRTVATHLSHVFDKLGVRSRVALAREAAQRFGAAEANG